MLHNVDGRFVPFASEGGHADFAARTPRELELVAELTRVFGRVGVGVRRSRDRGWSTSISSPTRRSAPDRRSRRTALRRRGCARGSARTGSAQRSRRQNLRVRARGPLPALRGGVRHVRRRPTGPRPATWRCARSRPPASTSAAASRPRSCRRSSPGSSSKRSARRNRWRISSPRFRSRSFSILTPASSARRCGRWRCPIKVRRPAQGSGFKQTSSSGQGFA